MPSIQLFSRAKINLTLDVIKKREDHYHQVEMIMQSIDLFDSIMITTKKEEGITLQCNHPQVPEDETNLAFKAALLLGKKYPFPSGLHIILEKNIPVAGGLGGGSGNGASVLKGIKEIFSLPIKREEMFLFASQLGSDVPFFLEGGTLLCKGRGTHLYPLPPLPTLPLLLIVPPTGLSTAVVYGNLRKEEMGRKIWTDRACKAIEKGDLPFLLENLGNDLEAPARRVNSSLDRIKRLLDQEGYSSFLSGSGPTLFLFPGEEIDSIEKEVRALLGQEVLVIRTYTSPKGIIEKTLKEGIQHA